MNGTAVSPVDRLLVAVPVGTASGEPALVAGDLEESAKDISTMWKESTSSDIMHA